MKTLLAICCAIGLSSAALAADDAYTLKADAKMSAVLKDLSGRRVTVHLRAGGELSGKLAVVGDHAVQISGLANKDFYDAIVAVEAIDAVEVKVR